MSELDSPDNSPSNQKWPPRSIGMDTFDLRTAVDPFYALNHPLLIEAIQPQTPQEADIEHYLDAIAPPLLDLLSNN